MCLRGMILRVDLWPPHICALPQHKHIPHPIHTKKQSYRVSPVMCGKEQGTPALFPLRPQPLYLQGSLRPHLCRPTLIFPEEVVFVLTGLKGILQLKASLVTNTRRSFHEDPHSIHDGMGDKGRRGRGVGGVKTCRVAHGLSICLSFCLCWQY